MDLRERACRYWTYREVGIHPQVPLPTGESTHSDQYLVAVAKFEPLSGPGYLDVIVGIWPIHCFDDDGWFRTFGLLANEDEGTGNLLGRWLDRQDAATQACGERVSRQKVGPFYWPQGDDSSSDSH